MSAENSIFKDQNNQLALNRLLEQLREKGISEPTLAAMNKAKRHLFIDGKIPPNIYDNEVISLGKYSSISQPSVVGKMTDWLEVTPESTVLEIGTASGWQAAILSYLAKKVITVEINQALAIKAEKRFGILNIQNIETILGDGSDPQIISQPVDRIMVTADVKEFYPYPPILKCLAVGGLAVLPIEGQLTVFQHQEFGIKKIKQEPGYRFVPLKGAFSW